jgi:hypothetical protein
VNVPLNCPSRGLVNSRLLLKTSQAEHGTVLPLSLRGTSAD